MGPEFSDLQFLKDGVYERGIAADVLMTLIPVPTFPF
jgi:hypothetical protein